MQVICECTVHSAHASEAGSRWDVPVTYQCIGEVNPWLKARPILGVLLFPGFSVLHPLTQTLASGSQLTLSLLSACSFPLFCHRREMPFVWLWSLEICTFGSPSHTLLARSFVLRDSGLQPSVSSRQLQAGTYQAHGRQSCKGSQ